MNRDGGSPAVRMPELLMRATLAGFCKAETLQNGNYFPRLEDWELAPTQPTVTV